MNNFSFKRFGLYAKAEVCSRRKFLLMLAGSAAAYFLIIHYITYLNFKEEPWMNFEGPTVMSWIAIAVFSMVFISTAFKQYFHKGYSIATMTLPVAQSEKFLFILAFYYVAVPLILVALGSLISLIWSSGCSLDYLFFTVDGSVATMIVCQFITQLSIFLLGALFFRRNPFFLTLLTLACVGLLFGYATYIVNDTWGLMDKFGIWLQTQWRGCDQQTVLSSYKWLSVGFNLIATTVLWVITWRFFRKVQITK